MVTFHPAIIFVFGFLLGYAFDNSWAYVTRKISKKKNREIKFILWKLRVHHNIFGYLLFILGFFFFSFLFWGIGIGIIVGHTIRDSLLFFIEVIQKDPLKIQKNVEKKLRKRINNYLKKLPKGKTTTYKTLAKKFNSNPRTIAKIVSTNKDKSVPCYKVIRSDGKIGGYNGLLGKSKKELLEKDSKLQ